ncbi:MAG: type II secretion system protein [Nitrospirae bacterium]|nr:type II secretion system protein [Magnetococcales bacterium]
MRKETPRDAGLPKIAPQKPASRCHADGFTLIELSLVLIIIAIMMGTVLRSDKVVDEGRIQRMALDQAAVISAVQAYVQWYHFLPGDDPKAQERWPEAINGNGDGVIDSASFEEQQAWFHLVSAHLLSSASMIKNPKIHLWHHVAGLSGVSLCIEDVPPLLASGLDRHLDDGDGRGGGIRRLDISSDGNRNTGSPWPIQGEGVTVCSASSWH